MRAGDWTIRSVEAERFRLDGGAMHGVVPKTLWSKLAPVDADNRVEYTTRCLLLEGHGRRILVETGNGDKWSPREQAMFAVEEGAGIARRLRAAHIEPDSIDTVITTHLHFDHIGGAVWRDETGTLRPTFPQARHITQKRELEDAFHPNERNRASYRQENLEPLAQAGLFQPVDGEVEIAPGLRVLPTPGHTPGHQSILIDSGGLCILFCGDVIPTSIHVRLPWVMAYDVLPLVTLETKRALYDRALRHGWILVWGHDRDYAAGRIARDAKGDVSVCETITLE